MAAKTIPVKFLRRFANYNEGEIAGFEEVRARAMIEGKVAVEVFVPKKKPDPKE